ncbi:hypothetical protein FHL15_009569 [Xylaria flabelliformis]|uniref:Uncharacterized protein n=1 Tax=Xylaria flabelliformis TaxID=2512241 RepID=A0A553HNI8_9PEZI|nr:hypothetical protein FHL15_009569 [Xylaria flabelliformis]
MFRNLYEKGGRTTAASPFIRLANNDAAAESTTVLNQPALDAQRKTTVFGRAASKLGLRAANQQEAGTHENASATGNLSTQNMNEITNASYVTSLGSRSLADFGHGITVLPVGEELLLFGPKLDDVMNREFLDVIQNANHACAKPPRMRNLNKDSDEFLRRWFDNRYSSLPVESL